MNKQRREKIQGIVYGVSSLLDNLKEIPEEEEECKDNIPENFAYTERTNEMEENCENLETAIESLEEGISTLEEIAGEFDTDFHKYFNKYVKII